jgi:septal ring factor EnvC (AmiA/AmiB activator)
MVDASFSSQRQQEDRAAAGVRQLWIFGVALAVILIGLGCVLLQRSIGGNSPSVVPSAAATGREQVSDALIETTKGLQTTQQQAVDQLQVVQDQLVAQKAETKKLSDQVAAVTEKLDALQQSVASIPAPSVAAPVPLPQPSKARGK